MMIICIDTAATNLMGLIKPLNRALWRDYSVLPHKIFFSCFFKLAMRIATAANNLMGLKKPLNRALWRDYSGLPLNFFFLFFVFFLISYVNDE